MTDHVLERELLQHAAALRSLARVLVGAGDADDLVQETTLAVLRRPPPRPGQLGGLLATVVRQLASKLRRGRSRRLRREAAAAKAEAVPAADHELARHEVVERTLRELLTLPEPYRETLLQRFFADCTPAAIATRGGVPVETVKTRLKRGLAMLRARLEARGGKDWRPALAGAFGLGRDATIGAAAAANTGAIVMGTGTKILLGGAVVTLAAAVSWLVTLEPPPVAPSEAPVRREHAATVAHGARDGGGAQPADPGERSELRGPPPPAASGVANAPAEDLAGSFLARFNSAWPLDQAVTVARALAALPGDQALSILRAIYLRIENAEVRRMILAPLIRKHPQLGPEFLHLGAEDLVAAVRAAALEELSRYAFVDFVADPAAYAKWRATHGALGAGEAMRASLLDHVARLRSLTGADLAAALRRIDRETIALAERLGVDLQAQFALAGMSEVLDAAMTRRDAAAAEAVWKLAATLGADESFLQRHAVPLLRVPDEMSDELRDSVYSALARCRAAWVGEALVGAMLATSPARDGSYYGVADAIAEHGDPSAIPVMIGMIEADDTYKTIYGVGYFGLRKLTGVPYDESHDGKWWRRWWEENQHRLPTAVRGRPIPAVRLR